MEFPAARDLGVHRADVYGTSTGGRLAQQLAARHLHLVRALGLGCASPGGLHGIEAGRWYQHGRERRGRPLLG
ncbi:alpha/beta fold hydrolase [Streptomyces globisporus]